MDNARYTAVKMLLRVTTEGAYSNITARSMLSRGQLSTRDISFAAALFYGTLERQIAIDAYIAAFCSIPLERLDREVLALLRTGTYQILYMDSIPDRASVGESVNLARTFRKSSAAGLINAVLRKIAANKNIDRVIDEKPKEKRMSILYSCPEWIVKMLICDYGEQSAKEFLENSLGRPPIYLRVNTLKTTGERLSELFKEKDIALEETSLNDCFSAAGLPSIDVMREYQDGLFHVQDLSSQACAAAVDARPGNVVYDMCGAPGGKSFTMAQYMQNMGTLRCFDISPAKLILVDEGAKRLGIKIIETAVNDARAY